jgi:hypothetical protein
MSVNYKDLKSERQWRSSTGLKESQFRVLVSHFADAYEQIHGESLSERKGNSSQESVFKTYEELLFFVLFSLKSGLTYDVLGFVFGLDGSNAQRNQKSALPVLRLALSKAGVMPARSFSKVKDFEAWFSADEVLILDGTEQRSQRPGDNEVQKEAFSGKKNRTP